VALVALVLGLPLAAGRAPAGVAVTAEAVRHRPRLVFETTGDRCDPPLAYVASVDVDSTGTVHLLDIFGGVVRRLGADGRPLAPLRDGDGGRAVPGIPGLISVGADGVCYGVNTFCTDLVRYVPEGAPGTSLPIRGLDAMWPAGYAMRFVARDADNFLWAVQRKDIVDGDFAKGTPPIPELLEVRDGRPRLLMRVAATPGAPATIEVAETAYTLVHDGWDMLETGEMVWADPDGSYRLRRGHPGDDATVVPLAEPNEDREVLARATAQTLQGKRTRHVPRIASVRWLDRDRILVQPVARLDPDDRQSMGVYDVVDRDGARLARVDLVVAHDPAHDRVFLTRGRLVHLLGVEDDLPPPGEPMPPAHDPSTVRIRCYDLRGIGK